MTGLWRRTDVFVLPWGARSWLLATNPPWAPTSPASLLARFLNPRTGAGSWGTSRCGSFVSGIATSTYPLLGGKATFFCGGGRLYICRVLAAAQNFFCSMLGGETLPLGFEQLALQISLPCAVSCFFCGFLMALAVGRELSVTFFSSAPFARC